MGAASREGQTAGLVSRGTAAFIDALSLLLFIGAVRLVLGGIDWMLRAVLPHTTLSDLFYFAGIPLLVAGYFAGSWWLTGQTPGMWLLGVRVVPRPGTRLTLGRALLRLVGMAAAILPLGLGFLWVLIDAQHRGWHDLLSGTRVVYAWPAPENPDFTLLKRIQQREVP